MLSKIKAAQLQARKNRDAVTSSLLTTLIGEAEMVGKNANRVTTDDEVIAVIQKFIKNINETVAALSAQPAIATGDRLKVLQAERAELETFLPKQLTADELTDQVHAIIAGLLGMKSTINVGDVMGVLKNRFAGRYDGKMASTIVKNLVSTLT